jgi:hypothetical protein
MYMSEYYGPEGVNFLPLRDISQLDATEKAKLKDNPDNTIKYAMSDVYYASTTESKELAPITQRKTIHGIPCVACVSFVDGFKYGTYDKDTLQVVGEHNNDLRSKYKTAFDKLTNAREEIDAQYKALYENIAGVIKTIPEPSTYKIKKFKAGQTVQLDTYLADIQFTHKNKDQKLEELLDNETTFNPKSGPMFVTTLESFMETMKRLHLLDNFNENVNTKMQGLGLSTLTDDDKKFIKKVSDFKKRITNLLGMFTLEHLIRHASKVFWVPEDLLVRPCFQEEGNKCLPNAPVNATGYRSKLNTLLAKFPRYLTGTTWTDYKTPTTADWDKTYFPFTRLGYTYDIAGMATDQIVGVNEYILLFGTPLWFEGSYWMEQFIDKIKDGNVMTTLHPHSGGYKKTKRYRLKGAWTAPSLREAHFVRGFA